MSDLLNKASLVMVPSGYKEDTVYSVIPTDGSGDLTLTRASNGTRVNSAGLVEVCPWNLLGYSEQFNNAYWNKRSGVTITADSTTAPNGTTTADTANYSSGDGYIWADLTLLPSTQYTISVYAKGAGFIYFNAFWGSGSSQSSNMTLTSEWQRLTYTFTTGSTTSLGDFGFYVSATCYIWGAQLNIGSTAKPYFPTTDRLNVPRLTYQNGGGGCPSLLLEKQSTNLLAWSEDFSNGSYGKGNGIAIATNSTTSPDGTINADKVYTNTTVNGDHYLNKSPFTSVSSSTAYTFSIFAKKGEFNYISIESTIQNDLYKGATINLNDGSVSNNTYSITPQVENYGNGWYRISVFGTTSSSQTSADTYIILLNNNQERFYTGDGVSGIYTYGWQLEASSYPTSYIPTTSSSATRVADGSPDTATLLSNKLSYSVFLDFYPRPLGNFQYFFIQKNSSANAEIIWGGTSGGTDFAIYDYTSGSICNVPINDGNRHKIVLSQASGKIDVFVDGSQVATQKTTSATGFYYVAFDGNPGIYKINELAIMSKIINADAIALTTL